MPTQDQLYRKIKQTIQNESSKVITSFKKDVSKLGFIPFVDKTENQKDKRTFWARHNDGPTVSAVFETDHITITINFDCEKFRAVKNTKKNIPPITFTSKKVNQTEIKYTKMDCMDFKVVYKKAISQVKKDIQTLMKFKG